MDPTNQSNGNDEHLSPKQPLKHPLEQIGLADLPRYWFLLRDDVGRLGYAASGFGLMSLKYAVEAGVVWQLAQRFYSPLDFLNPLLSSRQDVFQNAPDWLPWLMIGWSLAFLWIAVSMSVRRAASAKLSPWLGLLVIVPVFNLVFMLLLCLLPERQAIQWRRDVEPAGAAHQFRRAALGIVASQLVGLALLGIAVLLLNSYGLTIFMGTPVMMGAVAAFLFNRPLSRGLLPTLGVATLAMIVSGGVMLLFALEGVICIAMAAPLVLPLGIVGAVVGKAVADFSTRGASQMLPAIALLGVLGAAESLYRPQPTQTVTTAVIVDAPLEVVWRNVVEVPDLPPAEAWYFRAGVASPERARIEGHGVGATRYCEFTTGVFVEPITVWDEPRRLAFDVTKQPAPMFELSPYRHVHAPHLHGALRSTQGEFRLEALSDGRTRLQGTTWYELDMFPHVYWTLWSDAVIHRIHERVLRHIELVAEADQRG